MPFLQPSLLCAYDESRGYICKEHDYVAGILKLQMHGFHTATRTYFHSYLKEFDLPSITLAPTAAPTAVVRPYFSVTPSIDYELEAVDREEVRALKGCVYFMSHTGL